jgi:formyl-CoA transferase
LEGIAVLDLSNVLAGPMATMYLADFGAEVIKVEHPARGDELRRYGTGDEELFFKLVNRNKKTVTLNLKSERGQELVRRIAGTVDVVVEAFRPGTLERWNIGYERLREINEGLVMARITAYGQTGPLSGEPGFGTLAEAFAGAAYISGYPDRPPLLPAFGLGDATTAIHAAFAIVLALYHREANGGTGQFIDLALYEALFTLIGPHVIDFAQLGVAQERLGGRLPFLSPRNTYQTADGAWIAVSGGTQKNFERIAEAFQLEPLLEDPRFRDNQARIANVDELDRLIAEAVRKLSLKEVLETARERQAPVGPAYNVAEIFDDAQYRSRENIVTVPDDRYGEVRMQNVVPTLSETPGRIDHAGRAMGADNHEVYVNRLGLSEDEVARLAAEGTI